MHHLSPRAPGRAAIPHLLAVNGQDPTIFRRHAAIGRPLPVTSVRISLGPAERWVDLPIDHLPTDDELARLAADLGHVDRCPCGVLVLAGWPKPHTCAEAGQ